MLKRIKAWAKSLKREVKALYVAYRRPDVPWYAKVSAAVVVCYALSPVDLVPDFVPVLGYLDDLILIPLGVWLTVRMIPEAVMEECRLLGEDIFSNSRVKSWAGGIVIVLLWLAVLGFVIFKVTAIWK